MKLGHKIKKLRELKNLTQDFVASSLEMTQSSYSKIESNETDLTLNRLEQIAGIFDLQPEDIIGFNESMVFNVMNNKKASGLTINQISQNEKKIYDDYIGALKSENTHLKSVINKLLNKKPVNSKTKKK